MSFCGRVPSAETCGDKGCWACDLRLDLASMVAPAREESNSDAAPDPAAEPLPGEWAKLEQRLLTRMEAGLGVLVAKAANPPCAGPPQALELEVETRCLEMARIEMRASDFIPLTPGGLGIWLPLATALSHYMRGRLGLPLDPEKP